LARAPLAPEESGRIAIPVAPDVSPPDNFPPQTGGARGYPSGLAVTPDGGRWQWRSTSMTAWRSWRRQRAA
jgi:hypothetical protein